MIKIKMLSEGIVHLEDLSITDFIKAVRNLGHMIATEKLDGSNLWMGLDEDGKLFTSRAGKRKNAQKMYDESDYPYYANTNGFRAAHAALEAKEEEIKRVMQPGQTVEIEVLYGRQPNAVTYGAGGKNYIAFLRGVEGTADVVANQLATTLGNTTVEITVDIVDTTDGENLEVVPSTMQFQFTNAQAVPTEKLRDPAINAKLDELDAFLREPAGLEGSNATNFELITTNLGSFPADIRPAAKQLKADVIARVTSEFKLPIKKDLIDNFVSKIKPMLGADDVKPDEDVGIEGVVLRDPTTGDQIKLVDKEGFTTINQFNQSMRAQIGGVVKTLDQDSPLESRGGVLGELKIKIADLLGNKDLARGAGAKKVFKSVKGETPVKTIKAFVANLKIEDFQGVKRKVLALISASHKQLGEMLGDFKEHKDEYHLRLKSGKTMGLSDETVKKTFLTFAESRRDLLEMFDKVKNTKTMSQLIATIYGKAVKAIHEPEDVPETKVTGPVAESILQEKRYDNDKTRYAGKDAWTLLNTYLATLFTAAVIYQANDDRGIKLLKDKTNFKMTSWNRDMSPLNFWGYAVWKAGSPAVKKLVGNKTAQAIFKITRRIPPNAVKALHMDLSYGKDVPINWQDHFKTVKVLQQFEGLYTDRINSIMAGAFSYETMSHDEQVKLMAKLYFYVQQFVPSSPLLVRLRAIQDALLLNATGENDEMVQEMKLLSQISKVAEENATVSTATTASDIAPVEGGSAVEAKHVIVKMKRNPDVKRKKFQKPEDSAV